MPAAAWAFLHCLFTQVPFPIGSPSFEKAHPSFFDRRMRRTVGVMSTSPMLRWLFGVWGMRLQSERVTANPVAFEVHVLGHTKAHQLVPPQSR